MTINTDRDVTLDSEMEAELSHDLKPGHEGLILQVPPFVGDTRICTLLELHGFEPNANHVFQV